MTKEGTILDGKYVILTEVGRGGMSVVYLARDNRLNKQWAVKEIKNDGSKSAETLLKSLEREANILKNVDHNVLPRIVDIVNHEGTIYVVMDFIEGTSLSDVIRKEGAQLQGNVIEWGKQLASALDYLHSMNPPIIYRDMKPSNVMLKPEGGVKLIDFGTAKEYTIENNADTTALGTRGYAAPEQFGDSKGRGIYNTDARTDIYNLGATLYHIVTGKNPCEPPYEIKPIREWNPALSTGLEKIIIKCTQANPEDRYQSCSELLYALDHYTELDDTHRKTNKKKMTAFLVAVCLTLVAGMTSLVGFTKQQSLRLQNYNLYIEAGDNERVSGDYLASAKQYKYAFELDGTQSDAYIRFIDTYIDSTKSTDIDDNETMVITDGLTIVANKIKEGYGNVDKQSQVLYKMGITYFDEIGGTDGYKLAAKYFGMIDKNADEYELATYYKGLATILSSTNEDVDELIEEINSFADYNQNKFLNTESKKFENYKILGKIYTSYITKDETIAKKAEEVMEQAMDDLESFDNDRLKNEYYYYFNEALVIIYSNLATNSEDEMEQEIYYESAIDACDAVLINCIPYEVIGSNEETQQIVKYNASYTEMSITKAEMYAKLNDYDSAISTYVEAELSLGKNNTNSKKVYAKHLDYVYRTIEEIEQDPERWNQQQLDAVFEVYNDGKGIEGISDNMTWASRARVLDRLSNNASENNPVEDSTTDGKQEEGQESED